jgi:hypothetical protein
MMKKLIKRLGLALSLSSLGLAFAIAVPVAAQTPTPSATPQQSICEGVGLAGGGNGCTEQPGGPTVEGIIKTVINLLSLIVGVVAVIMIIIGGLKYITSAGDAGKVSSAKNTLLYAIIGLVIVALAQVIVRFVLNKVV